MTRKKAFAKLISSPGWNRDLKINDNTARTYKARFLAGKLPLDQIERLLNKAGWWGHDQWIPPE